jgi:predicted O-methyltransferase YrrM
MIPIDNLNNLMEYVRKLYPSRDSKGWASIDEYALMFTFSHIYTPDNVVEVGTCNGVSALAFAVGIPGNVYTWDIVAKTKRDAGTSLEDKIVRHIGDYANAAPVLATIQGRKLFFIDGDHTIEGCLKDIETSMPYLNPGDTLVFHDAYSTKAVRFAISTAINEIPKLRSMVKRRILFPSQNGFEVLET